MAESVFDYTHSAVVKCEACGADMTYSPEIGKLYCEYCKSTRDIQKRVPMIRDYLIERSMGDVLADDEVYKCPNCGGEVELGGFQTANQCPFCGATNIVKLQDIKGLKPDSILPFKVSKQSACDFGKKWLKKKLFAPSPYKKSIKADNFKGVYIPSFSFNADSYSTFQGRLGERRTRTVGSGNNKRVETYIYWYNVSGKDSRAFVNMMVEASPQIRQKDLDKLQPFDVGFTEAYSREYIAGFLAERYDSSLDDSFGIARDKMDVLIRKAILARYHADEVDYLNVSTKYSDIKFRYTLLPLWVCAYKYKEKLYRFLVNGRTGKSTGKTPVSGTRVGVFAFSIASVIAAIALLICHFALGIF